MYGLPKVSMLFRCFPVLSLVFLILLPFDWIPFKGNNMLFSVAINNVAYKVTTYNTGMA